MRVFVCKMRDLLVAIVAAAAVPAALAQSPSRELKLPPAIEKLAETADETVDVTLDPGMIRFAEKFLSDRKPDEAKAKRLLRGMRSVRVRVFEFGHEGAYTPRDLEPLRAELRGPQWSRVVEVRSRRDRENVDVFLKTENGEAAGLFVISAEPRELTIVAIDGALQASDLADIGGYAGVPRWVGGYSGRQREVR